MKTIKEKLLNEMVIIFLSYLFVKQLRSWQL